MTRDEIDARVQIQYTMAVYCNSVDSGDLEGVVSNFSENATLELSSGLVVRGRAGIRTFYQPVIGPGRTDLSPDGSIPLLRHNLTTSRVELKSASSALGWTYFLSTTRHGPDHSGRYVDRFGLHGDRWLLDERRILVEWYATPSWYQEVRLKAYAKTA